VNIISFFEVSKAAIKHMKPGSTIINTGSIQAYDPSHPILDYACTKVGDGERTTEAAQRDSRHMLCSHSRATKAHSLARHCFSLSPAALSLHAL
jgi:NAD(P)-dependent dehydrogenase (short-subunit alcohol dehydrogenase family)